MRLRNIKGAYDIISESDYLILDYEKYRGNFKKIFHNCNDIEIEIGMGKGSFIIEKAKQNPNINYIGIEKQASVLVSAIKKLKNENLSNLKIIYMDANDIDKVFANEVSKIYLNFSDPWPKKRHSNRRLTSKLFLEKYSNLFKDDRVIEIKTDNMNFFEFSLITLSENGYKFKEVNLNLYESISEANVQTEYEKKFSSLGMPIYRVLAIQFVDKEK